MSTQLLFWLETGGERTLLGSLTWPAALEADAKTFIRDNLFTERAGSPHAAQKLLEKGRVEPHERARFLAEKAVFHPPPPDALAAELDLDDFVADFGVALRALRQAPPGAVFTWEWR